MHNIDAHVQGFLAEDPAQPSVGSAVWSLWNTSKLPSVYHPET